MYCDIFDGLALSDVLSDPVNPKPFRLFAVGENALTKNGKKYVLTLSAEQIRSIAEYHRDKGEKIPLDSHHALLLAAEKAGVSETEAARAVPAKVAALGYAALKAEPDGLYAADIELLPLAQELFKAGSLRYYSPVIRGLDGRSPLRVTSIALDNVPALNNLDILAASAEDVHNPPDLDRSDLPGKPRKDSTMEKLEKALNALFPADALALSAETEEVIAGKLEALAAELPELRAAKAKVSELALSAENAEKSALIDKAVAENRVTNAEREGLLKLPLTWLSAELPKRPAGQVPVSPLPEGKEDEAALTAEEKAFAARMGMTEDEFLKSKKEAGE